MKSLLRGLLIAFVACVPLLAARAADCPDEYRPGHSGLTNERFREYLERVPEEVPPGPKKWRTATARIYTFTEPNGEEGKEAVFHTEGNRIVHARGDFPASSGEEIELWYHPDDPDNTALEPPVQVIPDVPEAVTRFNDAVDRELAAAVLDALENPDAVILGDYTPPGRLGQDGGKGMRVIFAKEISGNLKDEYNKTADVWVITFWSADPETGTLSFNFGPDSLRVRARLPGAGNRDLAGLSYDVQADNHGKAARMVPTIPARRGAPPEAHPAACTGCHGSNSKTFGHRPGLKPDATEKTTVFRVFDDYAERFGVERPGPMLPRQIARPEALLVPPGLIDVLRKRCEDGDGGDGTARFPGRPGAQPRGINVRRHAKTNVPSGEAPQGAREEQDGFSRQGTK